MARGRDREGGGMRHAVVLPVALILLTSVPALAQTTTGRLIGTTLDESEALLPVVSVTITSPALIGGAQNRITDAGGEFSFINIAPGDYTVTAALTGTYLKERVGADYSSSHAILSKNRQLCAGKP